MDCVYLGSSQVSEPQTLALGHPWIKTSGPGIPLVLISEEHRQKVHVPPDGFQGVREVKVLTRIAG